MKKLAVILGMLFTLSVNAQQQISGPASICAGQSATLIAQVPGFNTDTLQFQWSMNGVLFGLSNDTIVVTPGVGTWNYSVVIVTNGNQFVGNIYTTLTVNQIPTATAIGGAFCENSTISLTGGGGVSYNWSGPNGFSSSLQNPTITQATLAANGTYSLVVSNSFGCSDTTTTQVVVNPLPTPTITVSPNDTVCLGTQVALFATGGVSYSWSVGGNGPSTTWTPTTTGNLVPSVFVTDGNGCSALEFLPMVVNPAPAVTAVATPVTCFGGSNASITTNVSGGSSFSYLWSNGATTPFVSGLPIGNYSVTVTNNFGCLATTTAVVTEPLAAVTASLVVSNVSCNGGSNGSISVNASGGVGFYSYSWTGSGTGGNPRTNLTAGSYTVTVTDGNGCTASATGTVTQPIALTANADSIPLSCNGLADGSAFVSFISGGTSPYTYVWSNGATGSSTTGLSTGNYQVTVTDANGCQVSTATVVTQPAAITLSAQITSVTCNGGNNGSIDLTVSGGTAPYTYLWSNGFTGQDPQGLTAGNRTVTVTDANGCTATSSWVVNQPTALILNASTTSATCLGNGNGSTSVNVSGGTAPYSYSWTGGGTNNSITAPAGNYTVTVTDGNGCQSLAIATIGAAVPVTASAVVTPISCFAGTNGTIDLTVTGIGPFTYAWSNGVTTQDLTNLGWGNYTVTVTAANGCDTSLTFSLSQPAPLVAQISATNALCFNGTGSAAVLATGGTGNYTFLWSPQGGTGSTANNLPTGAYTVTVTDANGCTVQASTVVTQPSQLLATISNQTNIACAGNSNGSATVSVVGGTPNYSLLWSNGAQTQTAFGLAAGSYTVTVTDANGCTVTTTATITTAGSPLYANMTSNPSCGNSNTGDITTSVSGGQQPYSYQWSNGATSPSISGLAPGNYSVIITDANGCTWSGSQQILGSPGIVISLSNQTLCQNNNELINATFTGGTWPYQFIWTTPSGQTFTTNDVNPVEQGVYQLTIIDAFGCQASGSMFITLTPCGTTTSIESILSEDGVKLFPNPISSGQEFTLQLPSNIQEVEIRVMDFVGKTVFQGRTNEPNYRISTSGLAAGTYFVQIATVDGSVSTMKKFIIN